MLGKGLNRDWEVHTRCKLPQKRKRNKKKERKRKAYSQAKQAEQVSQVKFWRLLGKEKHFHCSEWSVHTPCTPCCRLKPYLAKHIMRRRDVCTRNHVKFKNAKTSLGFPASFPLIEEWLPFPGSARLSFMQINAFKEFISCPGQASLSSLLECHLICMPGILKRFHIRKTPRAPLFTMMRLRLLCRCDRMNPHCSLGSLLEQLASGVFKVEPEVIRLFSSNVIKNISNYNELVT